MPDVSALGGLRKTSFLERLLDSLLDPGRRERTVLATKLYGAMSDWPNDGKLSALRWVMGDEWDMLDT